MSDVEKLYLVVNWKDPECSPETMGIFTDLQMAMEMARLCTVPLHMKQWTWLPPQGREVLRLERKDHIILVEAVKVTCKPSHSLMDYGSGVRIPT